MDDGSNGTERQLFGGALSCFLPDNATDISVVRDIPDNQEVFCHETTDQSIMIDILEYQAHVHGEQAARFHFDELASSNDAEMESEITVVEKLPINLISLAAASEAWFLSGRQMISKFNEEVLVCLRLDGSMLTSANLAKNLVHIHLVLYRLPKYETDLLVVLNSPVAISKGSSSSFTSSSPNTPGGWQVDTFKHIASTLKLLDPGIFGAEE